MTAHMSDIFEDEDGWIIPRCSCGWQFGPVPDNETAVDVLMEHAADRSTEEQPPVREGSDAEAGIPGGSPYHQTQNPREVK